MSDYLHTLMLMTIYTIPSFVIQLFLCFKAKNKFIRHIPSYLCLAGTILTIDVYFNFSGLHHGWRELAALITGFYTAVFAMGVLCAFLVHKIYINRKNKKR